MDEKVLFELLEQIIEELNGIKRALYESKSYAYFQTNKYKINKK